MIKTREQLRAEADADVAEFAELLAESQSDTTGIPPPPKIEVSSIVLDPEPFDFLKRKLPPLAPGACCEDDGCHGFVLQKNCPGIWRGPGTTCEGDPCGGGDSCNTKIITFHDVILDCGCMNIGATPSDSFIWTDDGTFNDYPHTVCPDECFSGSIPPEDCVLTQDGDLCEEEPVSLAKVEHYFNEGADCGSIQSVSHRQELVLTKHDGLWTLVVYQGLIIGGSSALLFYGTSPTLSAGFVNQVTECSELPSDWDNPFLPCIQSWSVIGTAARLGTATVETAP